MPQGCGFLPLHCNVILFTFSSFFLKQHLSVRLLGVPIVIVEGSITGGAPGLLSCVHLSFISASSCSVEEIKQWFLKSPPPLFSHIPPAFEMLSALDFGIASFTMRE